MSSDAAIADGAWHRVAFAWDDANRTLYVDGVAVTEDSQSGPASCVGGLSLGCGDNASPATFFTGLIDDVRIYNRAVKP